MRLNQIIRALPALALVAAAGLAQAAPARGDGGGSSYQEDRAACAQIAAPDSRAACIREAGAARQAERAGKLSLSADADYQRNAEQRCNVFREPVDRDACIARVKNGPASGSVSGGGVLLEAETLVPVATPGAKPMPMPAPMRGEMEPPKPPKHKHGPKHGPKAKPEPKPMPEGAPAPMPAPKPAP